MEPFEVMTSESQERMLAIVEPANLDRVLEVARRWEVRASVVGTVTAGGGLRILDAPDGEVLADIPAASLHEDAPLYDRPQAAPGPPSPDDDPAGLPAPVECGADLLALLADPAWAYRQYDHQLFLNTIEAPGADAAVLRLGGPGLPRTGRGLALSTDGNHRWCAVDPKAGTAMVVAESALNVACAGARPVALVNCLNFGNPEHPEVMWQLSQAIDGMGDACRALGIPVIGGNVSLYNESHGRDIDPTPIVGVLGLIDHLDRRPPPPALIDNGRLLLLGVTEPSLAGSRWAVDCHGKRGGTLPPLDLELHARLLAFVQALVVEGSAAGLHDVSEGGLAVALTEMAIRSGFGFRVAGVAGHAALFSESASRLVVCAEPDAAQAIFRQATAAAIPATFLGGSGGDRLVVEGLLDMALADADAAWRDAIPMAVAAGGTS
jgi:phosphoribosylformylglycinamidine synthase